MRVAALYDIHGNLPALEAVLAEVMAAQVDQVVVGGDVVAGPMPRQSLKALLEFPLPVDFVQGNADAEVAQAGLHDGQPRGAVPESVLEITRWAAQQLTPGQLQCLADWPFSNTMTIPGLGRVLFCHATPRSNTEVFTRLTPEKNIAAAFAGVEADVVVCGHTHMPFDRRVGHCRVLNAGSVGMPYGRAGASWLLLGPEVQFRHTTYDFDAAATRIHQTNYPQAESFAIHNVLNVPSEEEALAFFHSLEHPDS